MIVAFAYLVLIACNIWILMNKTEPEKLRIIRERYSMLREYIVADNKDPRFNILRHPIILTAYDKKGGDLGYNTNKGYEIGFCIDGEPNEIFHVLFHELAHSTVSDYGHGEEFWKNFRDLKDMCTKIGLYEMIPEKTEFCGKYIQDV